MCVYLFVLCTSIAGICTYTHVEFLAADDEVPRERKRAAWMSCGSQEGTLTPAPAVQEGLGGKQAFSRALKDAKTWIN